MTARIIALCLALMTWCGKVDMQMVALALMLVCAG